MEDSRVTYGSRIKFTKQDHLLVSHKIYSNGQKMVRLIINTTTFTYNLVDPVTGFVLLASQKKYSNLEVVQKNAKKALKEFLGIQFEKEPKRPKKKAPVVNE